MILDVWVESCDAPIGQLIRGQGKSMTFKYAENTPPNGRLSMAMPIVDIEYTDVACRAFFGNLLFEGQELDRVVAVHNVDRDDVAGLLYHLGIDCPGAVSITPQGAGPGKRPGQFPQDYEEITEERLTAMVASLHFKGRLPDGSRDPSPVAGVQPKIAVTYIDDKFYLPLKDSRAPTTHILKVSPKDDTQITKHEAAILSIARQVGIDTTECARMVFKDEETCADIETILSTRFDRTIKTIDENIEIRRIHSEDFCQALGLPRDLKYERNSVDPSRKFSMAIRLLASSTDVHPSTASSPAASRNAYTMPAIGQYTVPSGAIPFTMNSRPSSESKSSAACRRAFCMSSAHS